MTALSTSLGTLPIALALRAGSESRMPMGIAVVGGLVLATGLTLYVVPAVYAYISKQAPAAPGPRDEANSVAPKMVAVENGVS